MASNKLAIGIIPARLYSTRFPKKILADICGKPMVVHTAEQAAKSKRLSKVIIAIDDKETYNSLKDYSFDLVMTSNLHQSGTDRVAEVSKHYQEFDIIINVQADEPFIEPAAIDLLIESFNDADVQMSTLINTFLSELDLKNPNVVKAYVDSKGFAKDFKRAVDDVTDLSIYKHLGIYGFLKNTLEHFVSLERSVKEKQRSLEQMRALDNNISIKAVLTEFNNFSIDTQEDYSLIKKKVVMK